MRRFSVFVILMCWCFSCKKSDPPQPPEAVQLVYPESNSECTSGQSLGGTTSSVTFRWAEALRAESYELRVTNIETSTTQVINTAATSASLPIEKGVAFSWLVRARNNEIEESVSSSVWNFYNAGSNSSFAPFPAEIIGPRMSEKVFKDINNQITLAWLVSDLDNDIDTITIYFGTEDSPASILSTHNAGIEQQKVTVVKDTLYYWRIVTTDAQGNASDSGTFSFLVL